MNRRPLLLLVSVAIILGVVTLAATGRQGPTVLDRAAKAKMPAPPVAVLIELGFKDKQPSPCSGKASVKGATVAQREAYRFHTTDKLIAPNAWEATSHRPMRGSRNNPALALLEGLSTVGIVLHLTDIQPGATITIEPKDKEFERAEIAIADVLGGKPVKFSNGKALVRRISVATPFAVGPTEDDFPAAAYGPDGTLWAVYVSYSLKDPDRRAEPKNLKTQPADFRSFNTPEFHDQLFVRAYRDGKWGDPIAITGPAEDIVRCSIAVEDGGDVWVAYASNRGGTQAVHMARVGKQGAEAAIKVSPEGGPHVGPVLCPAANGRLRLADMGWTGAEFGISTALVQSGKLVGASQTLGGPTGENHWYPAIAAGPGGKTAVAYDIYHEGDYDVRVVVFDGDKRTEHVIAASSKFEARPSIVFDAKGRLWIAYEEGPDQWGKDSGALSKTGNPLYSDRRVRVACLDTDGTIKEPAAALASSAVGNPGSQNGQEVVQKNERSPRYAYPQIGVDGKGRVWLTYRQNFGLRSATLIGNYWLTFARRLDGDQWSPPIEIHHSDGFLDSRPPIVPHPAGGIILWCNTDGRYTTPEAIGNDIYMSIVDLPGEPVEPKLVAHDVGAKDPKLLKQSAEEQASVKRMREYRMQVGSQNYQALRGEFHRHTEISFDGAADGSLEDMFRYGIDAAAMDWIGNGDHDNGGGREYTWWLTQKLTDAYHVANVFTPMFTYERSVSYPMGHRNCMFAKRGIRTLPRLAAGNAKAVANVHPDDTKMLYRYLKELGGICASHTSATTMGTDWRDNDKEVEPVVEIYQGDRMSYEQQGAPRAGFDPKSGHKPANIAGWHPDGFIDHALRDKGYRLGFESSSDHWSTHISFCVPLVERHDRAAILDAIKKRHCYGATDDILLAVHSGEHLMGDEFKAATAPPIDVHAVGTGPIARIDVLKDSRVVKTFKPDGAEYTGTWTDPQPSSGVHYYYVRVEQKNGQLAWASPMWIEMGR